MILFTLCLNLPKSVGLFFLKKIILPVVNNKISITFVVKVTR